jgi:Rrf2 family transcriptional regulator, cysteine metabolism repressor
MTLSTRSQYGLRALFSLARMRPREPISLKRIADENAIPFKYLEQLFIQLRRAGLIEASPGVKGGYYLARPAGDIRLGEVIRALDGTIAPVNCVSRIAYSPCTCPDEDGCPLRKAMEEVRTAIVEVIDRKTIADYL